MAADLITLPARRALQPVEANRCRRVEAFAQSHSGDPRIYLTYDREIDAGLPLALATARGELAGADPEEIREALIEFAGRKGAPLPTERALAVDIALLAQIPADLFKHAFMTLWSVFRARRLPEVWQFRDLVQAQIDERERLLRDLVQLDRHYAVLRPAKSPGATPLQASRYRPLVPDG